MMQVSWVARQQASQEHFIKVHGIIARVVGSQICEMMSELKEM